MHYLDFIFYVAGVVALSAVGFYVAKFSVGYMLDSWIPFVRVTITLTDENGVKKSKSIWLDKRDPEDMEVIRIMDKVKAS